VIPADPHAGQPVLADGAPLGAAAGAVVLFHGRNATASGMIELARTFAPPSVALLAPEAAGHSWYPERFLAPLPQNEPWLSSALRRFDQLLDQIAEHDIPAERTLLLGFSQGACLALEYTARRPRRYGGVVGLTGALLGPIDAARDDAGTFDGTPVFLGTSDADLHVPEPFVRATADVFRRLGAGVTLRIYPGMGHTVNGDEVAAARSFVEMMVAPSSPARG
jgi:phospholipase/carboxylesterase